MNREVKFRGKSKKTGEWLRYTQDQIKEVLFSIIMG